MRDKIISLPAFLIFRLLFSHYWLLFLEVFCSKLTIPICRRNSKTLPRPSFATRLGKTTRGSRHGFQDTHEHRIANVSEKKHVRDDAGEDEMRFQMDFENCY